MIREKGSPHGSYTKFNKNNNYSLRVTGQPQSEMFKLQLDDLQA